MDAKRRKISTKKRVKASKKNQKKLLMPQMKYVEIVDIVIGVSEDEAEEHADAPKVTTKEAEKAVDFLESQEMLATRDSQFLLTLGG
ncbi:hypothetical protein AVEN_33933-1 [Araneus ventricosus]|uniref:Uncharacterized protein n=1 Tax=Araneus ventricosus TaxID=182803 RepID=A0A4Y2TDB5_ARAVE|nr:hypothetical protein AVEN_195041-1 [Araneus ventricosus]GBN98633.1 hypothetical protein AVEN_33933-1 [Araneus ventricosus]